MPKILFKDILIEIRKSFGRFLSITLIVALGVAFFAGIKASAPDMKHTADKHFDDYSVQDIQIYSTFGIRQDDLDALKKLKGVQEVQGVFSSDYLTYQNQRELVVKLISWSPDQKLNLPRLMEGRMPEKEDECVIEADSVNNELFGSFKIGDTIKLESGNEDPITDTLKKDSFKIVGKAYNPNYLSYEKGTSSIGSGNVDTFIYVNQDVIKADYYTEADLLVTESQALNSYSDEYFDVVEPVTKEVDTLAISQIAKYKAELQDELDLEKRKAQKELDDAQSQIEAGHAQLEEAASRIQEGLAEISKNEDKLASSESELASGWQSYYSNKKKAEDGLAFVNDGISQIQQAQNKLPELEGALNSLNQAQAGLLQINQAKSGLVSLNDGIHQLATQILQLKMVSPQNPMIPALEAKLNELIEQEKQIIQSLNVELKWTEITPTLPAPLPDPAPEPSPNPAPGDNIPTDNDTNSETVPAKPSTDVSDPQTPELSDTPQNPETPENPDTPENPEKPDLPATVDPIQVPDISQALAVLDTQYQAIVSQAGSETEIETKKQQVQAGIDQIKGLESQLAQLQALKKQLDDGMAKLPAAYDTLVSAQNQISEGKKQLADAKAELSTGQQDYESGLRELLDNERKFQEEKKKADQQIQDAQDKIDDIKGEWIVLDRNSHYSYRDYQSAAERMERIATVFPLFFYLVAALVCMTTMTRMVDEQRSDIGTLKSLGYSKFQIAFKYLAYAGLASIAGCILGLSLGLFIFPSVIFFAWNTMYNLESIQFVFQPSLMLGASLSVTAIVLAATFYSIYKELMEVPSALMRPKAAKAGKKILLERIPIIWKRLSFMQKVTLRNLFRYKKRFFMTVIGIAGCSALLVAGFGLNDSISSIISRQFQDIYHYDASVLIDLEENPDLPEQVSKIDGVTEVLETEILPVSISFDHKDMSASVNIIEDPQALKKFMTFIPMNGSSEDMKLNDDGVFIAIKTAEKLNAGVGDTIEFETTDHQIIQTKVAGIFDQYVNHQIYVTKDLYETWGIDEKPNQSLLLINDSTDEELETEMGRQLMDLDGVNSVEFYSALIANFQNMISAIELVVIVLVISAGLLAFVVLYNLSNVNISERQREIATIKVLGFTEREVNAYVNRESILLALIGSIVGLFLGIVLHSMIMSLAELDDIRFGRVILGKSYLISLALTMVFAFLVNWIMKFKLRKIEMVESLKAVE